jgi:hypothetical protein
VASLSAGERRRYFSFQPPRATGSQSSYDSPSVCYLRVPQTGALRERGTFHQSFCTCGSGITLAHSSQLWLRYASLGQQQFAGSAVSNAALSEPMEEKPKSAASGSQVVAGAVGFVVGLSAEWFAVLSGAHGGSPWLTAILSAPASLLSGLIFGDPPIYVAGMALGTAILWSAYGIAVVRNPIWAWLVIALFHAAGGAALLLM